jgi:4-hydroxybenzoyl-CoA thioesterase
MLVNRRTVRIEWGDCDPAGIVYFPRYFEIFDACTVALFERAGFRKREMLQSFGTAGIPLVDIKSRFMIPSRFGEDVIVESSVTKWGESSFVVYHRLMRDTTVAVECFETRVWVARSAEDPDRFESRPIPAGVKEKFTAAVAEQGK